MRDGKTRSLKELGQVLLDNQGWFISGLCLWASFLSDHELISNSERYKINRLIRDKYPNKSTVCYVWTPCEIQPRIDFINEHMINAGA